METQLFTWKEWDELVPGWFKFDDCELVNQVGKFPAGTKIDCIELNFYGGYIELYPSLEEREESYRYKTTIVVGEEIEE